MNASASALIREREVQSKIGKIRTFGRYARVVSSALFGFGLVVSVGILLIVLFGPFPKVTFDLGLPWLDGVTTVQLTTPALKAWAILASGALSAVSLAFVYQHYRLFGNLAAGAIYTAENVRRVRNIGLLSLLAAVLNTVIPAASALLVTFGFIDVSTPIDFDRVIPSSQSLSAFISAGLILLASWIMDLGLHEKEHADALRRDADLVI